MGNSRMITAQVLASLPRRARQVAELLKLGLADKEIAAKMGPG
jgi:DNA-binding NarL/FixJ family response regulator